MVARARSPSLAAADSSTLEVVTEQGAAELAWRRLIEALQRIRHLQRIWGLLGGHLRTEYPASLRDRLREVFP